MKTALPIFLIAMSVGAQAEGQSGFDDICAIYDGYNYNGETVGEIWLILGEDVIEGVSDISALQVYSALNDVDPCSRYEVFQEVAEDVQNKVWECPEMEDLLDTAKPEDCMD